MKGENILRAAFNSKSISKINNDWEDYDNGYEDYANYVNTYDDWGDYLNGTEDQDDSDTENE